MPTLAASRSQKWLRKNRTLDGLERLTGDIATVDPLVGRDAVEFLGVAYGIEGGPLG
jgi:hypothetical protein